MQHDTRHAPDGSFIDPLDTGPERFTLWPGPYVSATSHPEGITLRQAEQLTGIAPALLREEWWRRFGWAVRHRRTLTS